MSKEINTISKDNPSLRPQNLESFLGQREIKRRVKITLDAAKSRQEPLPHQLLAGPPGLGKTTLAQILANEMGAKVHITSGPSIEKPADLAGTLVNLARGDILFIDEIHRLSPVVEEFLYPAMEDRKLDILVDQAQGGAKTLRIDIEAFTLIGATTKPGSLSSPLRSRFQTVHRLELYNPADLAEIVAASASKLGVEISPEAAHVLASRARGTPRTANNHLLWTRDYASAVKDTNKIDETIATEALAEIGIETSGLDETDIRILKVLIDNFHGGPVGIQSLAVACGEDSSSIEDIHEPYLIAQGYLQRTHNGRTALEKAYQLLKKTPKAKQGNLL